MVLVPVAAKKNKNNVTLDLNLTDADVQGAQKIYQ